MRRALVLLFALPACTSGEDVMLIEGRSSCVIEAGEDVCTRFAHLDVAEQADLVPYLQAASMIAKDARETLLRVQSACEAMARALNVPISTGSDQRYATKGTCHTVAEFLDNLETNSPNDKPTIEYVEPTCAPAKLPTCMALRTTYRFASCDIGPVVATTKGPRTLRAELIAAALERHLPVLVTVTRKAWLEAPFVDPDHRPPSVGACLDAAEVLIREAGHDQHRAREAALEVLDEFSARDGNVQLHNVQPNW